MLVASRISPSKKNVLRLPIDLTFFLCALCIGATLPDAGHAQQTLHHVYRFDTSSIRLETTDRGMTLQAGQLPRTWEKGQPQIPYDNLTFLVPRGSAVTRVRATRHNETQVIERTQLALSSSMVTSEEQVVFPKDPVLVGKASAATYPDLLAQALPAGALHGYQLMSVRVYPIRFDSESGSVLASSRIEIDIELSANGTPPITRQRFSQVIEDAARQTLSRLVANPEAIATYDRPAGVKVASEQHGFQPTNAPSLEGSPVDYVIITSQALEASFQVLADWKTRRGVPTVIRTVEWIEANYRHGSDIQETIRTFIQDAYSKWGNTYVLLGGDTDIIPARYLFSDFGPDTERFIPSDMYFSCLDGNWNADGDGVWGEAAVNGLNLGDQADLYSDVFVGRLAISTPFDVATIVSKIMEYENPSITDYQADTVFLGEVLFPIDWTPGMSISMDGGDFNESMAAVTDTCTNKTKLYENNVPYLDSSPLTLQSTLDRLNLGAGFVNHIGHGFRYNMSCGDRSLVNSDAKGLTNGNRRFVLYMLNCTATAYDFPCLGEAYLKTQGGAVAVLGSSRAAFALPSRNYNLGFFQALHTNKKFHIGETFVESRLAFTPNASLDTADHYTHFLYNILADPELVIHTCDLGTTVATYGASVGLGMNSISIHVTVDGLPKQNALVCLQKGTEEYVVGMTNLNGDVNLGFTAETAGSLTVTVSGQNMSTHLGSITVNGTGGAYVHSTGFVLDDDNLGGSAGNGDAILDAGETVELNVSFQNSGNLNAASVSGTLTISSSWAIVLDAAYTLGTVNTGLSKSSLGQLRVWVDPNAPDGTVLPLQFRTTDGVDTWTDVINKVIHAPALELVLLVVDDSAPGGNGDGVIQAGESFDLTPTFKNYGTGTIDSLGVTLSSADPDIAVTTSSILLDTLLPLSDATPTTSFRLTETTIAENSLTLTATDRYSRVTTWNVTLRPPAPPATPIPDASTGANIIVTTWTPSVDPDLAGYHIFRATNVSGPWTRISVDHTARIAYFRDNDLLPSTQYFYHVTAVDSSGNQSQPSLSGQINTAPGLLSGWPINMLSVSSCPPAVGDITGDGFKEVVAGNQYLYAWDVNGIELLDDDGDAQTWGVFADEITSVAAAIVIANFDPEPGLEVFATVWNDSNKAFIVRSDGTFAPGWPQTPNPTSPLAGYWGAPGAIDIDGDGFAEVFAPSRDGNLYAWHPDGSPVGATAAFKSGLGSWSRCSPTFANLDTDPEPEIVYGAPNGTLFAWNVDGTDLPFFPLSLGTLALSSTAIGDVNNDGHQDIVFILEDDQIHIIDSVTGEELPGWPVSLSIASNPISPSPALADFNFDGFLDVVIANNAANVALSAVQVYDYQGVLQPGWPQLVHSHASESSPIVADFSGDGIPDIVFGNEAGFIFGWDKDGNELTGFPLTIGDFIRSTPMADDVDNDGDIDLVLAGWDQNLYVWDFTAPFSRAAAQWPTFKHDAQRTGQYTFRPRTTTDVGDPETPEATVPAQPFLSQNFPNPFNPLTTIRYGVHRQEGVDQSEVRIEIFDVNGRLVRQLVRGLQSPGTHQAIWDGRNDKGKSVSTGVYFYRLNVDAQVLTRKMLLMK